MWARVTNLRQQDTLCKHPKIRSMICKNKNIKIIPFTLGF